MDIYYQKGCLSSKTSLTVRTVHICKWIFFAISSFAIKEELPSEGLKGEEGTNQIKTWFYRSR